MFHAMCTQSVLFDAQIPNYPNLPSKLLCLLHNLTLHVCSSLSLSLSLIFASPLINFSIFRLIPKQMKYTLR